jgi:hypothetical protein
MVENFAEFQFLYFSVYMYAKNRWVHPLCDARGSGDLDIKTFMICQG